MGVHPTLCGAGRGKGRSSRWNAPLAEASLRPVQAPPSGSSCSSVVSYYHYLWLCVDCRAERRFSSAREHYWRATAQQMAGPTRSSPMSAPDSTITSVDLKHLISRICSGEVGRLVLSHKDRLLRFGSELVFSLCEHFSCEVVIVNARRGRSL